MATSVQDIVTTVEQMSVKDLSELVKAIEDKFGVKAASGGMMMMPGALLGAAPAAGGGAAAKSSFKVVMKNAGPQKVGIIKAVKDITSKGLKESKDLVDKLPAVIKEGISEDEANKIKEQLTSQGAEIEIQ